MMNGQWLVSQAIDGALISEALCGHWSVSESPVYGFVWTVIGQQGYEWTLLIIETAS